MGISSFMLVQPYEQGVGALPRDWIRNDKMEWAIRQVTQQADRFIYDYSALQCYLTLRQQLVQQLNVLGVQTYTDNLEKTMYKFKGSS